jgi:hypothetical protein
MKRIVFLLIATVFLLSVIQVSFSERILYSYIEQIENGLSIDEKNLIVSLPQEGLISLHLNHSMNIRNKWVGVFKSPLLYFILVTKGFYENDSMSMYLMEKVWKNLYIKLDDDVKKIVDETRREKSDLNNVFIKLTQECNANTEKFYKTMKSCLPVNKSLFSRVQTH